MTIFLSNLDNFSNNFKVSKLYNLHKFSSFNLTLFQIQVIKFSEHGMRFLKNISKGQTC